MHEIRQVKLNCRGYSERTPSVTRGSLTEHDVSPSSTANGGYPVADNTLKFTSASGDAHTTLLPDSKSISDYSRFLVKRSEWDYRYAHKQCRTALKSPITDIYVSESFTENCYSSSTCVEQNLMSYYVPVLGDVTFNFVVTGDGMIYEGLAWDCKVDDPAINTTSIHVMFTGMSTYRSRQIAGKQYGSLKALIHANIANGRVHPAYAVGPICCVVFGDNPGVQMYQKLSTFDRFLTGCNNSLQCPLFDFDKYHIINVNG